MVIRRQSFVREHIAAGVGGGTASDLAVAVHAAAAFGLVPFSAGLFSPRASDVTSRAPHLVRDWQGYGRHLTLPS
jgi:hypothetical protein